MDMEEEEKDKEGGRGGYNRNHEIKKSTQTT